jgi:hypothetical protein
VNTKHTAIATLDTFAMPPPPNTGPAEWAITKIETTLRKRKEPGWSEDDAIKLQTAMRHCTSREEANPHGLQKRLGLNVGKLGACIVRRSSKAAAWKRFGHFARPLVPILDGVCAVAEACDVIDAIVNRKGVIPPFSTEELQKLAYAGRRWNVIRPLLPKNLEKRFVEKWYLLTRVADNHYGQPVWIALAQKLHISIRSTEEVHHAVMRSTPGIAALTRLLDDPDPLCSSEDVARIEAALDECLNLPETERLQLYRGCCDLVRIVLEGSTPPCKQLKRILRIRKRSNLPGYHHLLGRRFVVGFWFRLEKLP